MIVNEVDDQLDKNTRENLGSGIFSSQIGVEFERVITSSNNP